MKYSLSIKEIWRFLSSKEREQSSPEEYSVNLCSKPHQCNLDAMVSLTVSKKTLMVIVMQVWKITTDSTCLLVHSHLYVTLNVNHVLISQDAQTLTNISSFSQHPINNCLSSKHNRTMSWLFLSLLPTALSQWLSKTFGQNYSFDKQTSPPLEESILDTQVPYKTREIFCSKLSSLITLLCQLDFLS